MGARLHLVTGDATTRQDDNPGRTNTARTGNGRATRVMKLRSRLCRA